MATADQMIDGTIFGTTTDDSGVTLLTVNMDGETYIYWPDNVNYYRDDNIVMNYNMTGPEGGIYIPGIGTLFPNEIGWAVNAQEGNDTVVGFTLSDALKGGAGNDLIKGEAGLDILHGDGGKDTLYGGVDDDWTYGGSEDDHVYGGAGDDWMHGGAGNDWMNGDQGADTMSGGLGNDMYRMSKGDSDTDQIKENAGEGFDWVYTDLANYTLGANIEGLILDAGLTNATTLHGNYLNNDIRGANGADNVWGWSGNDTISGNGGNDTLRGGYGNDTIFGGSGTDKLYGQEGADYLDGGSGSDTMEGGTDNDTYVVEDATDVVVEGLDAGSDTVQSLLATTTLGANIENLTMLYAGVSEGYGNALNNIINGSVWNNWIDGGTGNDTVFASFGNDTVYGNTGNDGLMGEIGDDRLFGDDGDDTMGGGAGGDWEYGGNGNDQVHGGDGVDFLYGGAGNDGVFGDGSGNGIVDNDYVYGDAGNDTVDGGAGNDVVRGGDGSDMVYGGAGNDQIYGDAGVDLEWGGAGSDRFVFRATTDAPMGGTDRIMDFVSGVDKIDLSQIDANSMLAGNQAFSFTGAKPFFASPGDLSFSTNLVGSFVEGDLNGDGLSDFRILVVGDYAMSASDFIL